MKDKEKGQIFDTRGSGCGGPLPGSNVTDPSMTPERIAEVRSKPHGPDVAALMDTVEFLWYEQKRTTESVNALQSARDREQRDSVKLRNRIAQLEGEKRATTEALAHWRREADRDFGEICRLRQELAEALFELANK